LFIRLSNDFKELRNAKKRAFRLKWEARKLAATYHCEIPYIDARPARFAMLQHLR